MQPNIHKRKTTKIFLNYVNKNILVFSENWKEKKQYFKIIHKESCKPFGSPDIIDASSIPILIVRTSFSKNHLREGKT